MKTCCTVVIGHVDHGKTALVRALTGAETDRLPEEKARGLSITPGFAHCSYPGGVIDLVDAPGHADFVHAMIAGAAGAQAALIVISIADGIGAQTVEHLGIADLLGISQAVVAVTKSDLVTLPDQAQRLSEIRMALLRTAYADAPVVSCSAATGAGIDTLHEALAHLLSRPMPCPSPLNSFLPIDRAFTLPGHGTIVTGTLLGQDLSLQADVVLHPAGQAVSIRSLQSRGAKRACIQTGERMAANLRGVTPNDVPRGAVLYAGDIGAPSQIVDVHLKLLREHAGTLKHMQKLRVLFGTTSAVAEVRLFKRRGGARSFAQFRFDASVVCFAGQRAILRRLSPAETIGGAEFLDPQAKPARANDTPRLGVLNAALARDVTAIATALCAAGGGVANGFEIARLARLHPAETSTMLGDRFVALNAEWIASSKDIETAKTALLDALAIYHQGHPLQMMAPRSLLKKLRFAPPLVHHVEDLAAAEGCLRRDANRLSLCAHDPLATLSRAQCTVMTAIEDTYRQAGLTTPATPMLSSSDPAAALLQLLIDTNQLVSLHNIALNQRLVFHANTLADAAHALAVAFPTGQTFTTSHARTALNTSRRIIVPLLEHFDSLGVTRRHKDTRQIADLNLISQAGRP